MKILYRYLNLELAIPIFWVMIGLIGIFSLKKVSVTIGFWPIHLIFLFAAVYFTYKRSINQPLFNLKSNLNTK